VRGKDFVERWLQHENYELAPHLLLVGRTGSGKTTAAKYIVARAKEYYTEVCILDWDAEYRALAPEYEPPFLINATNEQLLADSLAEVERAEGGGHATAFFLRQALKQALKDVLGEAVRMRAHNPSTNAFAKAAEKLRARALEVSYALRAAMDAAVVRLEELAPYIDIEYGPLANGGGASARVCGLKRGVYSLFAIPSIWSRAAVRQFLSVFHVVARRAALTAYEKEPAIHDPPDPSILVIEEGSVGATTTYLVHLLTEARKALTKVIIVSQRLPDAEVVQNCEVLLFDTAPSIRRALHAAIPDSRLRVGEAWWVRRDGEAKRIDFRMR
jgi:energy-coupling factor transporter ATP-binding protein EcfA2